MAKQNSMMEKLTNSLYQIKIIQLTMLRIVSSIFYNTTRVFQCVGDEFLDRIFGMGNEMLVI